MSSDTETSAHQLFAEAVAHHRAGKSTEAEQFCCRVLEVDRNHSEALALLGMLHANRRDYDEAIRLVQQSLEINRAQPSTLTTLGYALYNLKRYAEAASAYEEAIALKPGEITYRDHSSALLELNRLDDALASADAAIGLGPDNPRNHFARGNALFKLGRFSDSVSSYDRAIELKPDYLSAYTMRAHVLTRLKRDDEARANLYKAIEIDPHLRATAARLLFLRSTDRLIGLDYPVVPAVRWGEAAHPQLADIIGAGNARYAATIAMFTRYAPQLRKIPNEATGGSAPHWNNPWLPAADAISLYGFLASRNPRRYIEIGSGMSTRFARQAIADHGLRTQIISIDPEPRSEIDAICDSVIRSRLEDADLGVFDGLTADDIVFCDNSHRSFQNSDVTVFFLEVLPGLKGGPLIGVHDIFLPYDYPAKWLKRFYNEQYLLACWLLAGDHVRVELPVHHIATTPDLRQGLAPIFADPATADGAAFWFTLS